MNIAEIESSLLDERLKGIPGGVAPFALSEIGRKGWNLLAEDLPLPACVLRAAALDRNERWMQEFLKRSGAVISPHGKTTMSPQLFKRQIDDGAWAMTVGNVHQIQVARHYGFERILLANQLVGRQGYRYVLDELKRDPGFEFYCLVDSVALVERMASAARARPAGRPIQVLLEGGIKGQRTGVRDLDQARAVARAVKAAAPHLALRGVEGFEGTLAGADAPRNVAAFLDFLVAIARMIDAETLCAPGPLILSAGGSAYYDIVVDKFAKAALGRETMVVTRSGCYLTHDSGTYKHHFADIRARSALAAELGQPLAAMEVWAYVQSRPEPTRALVTMGKRDVSFDSHLPEPLRWYRPGASPRTPLDIPAGHKIVKLNDQHGFLDLPADSPLQVGDMVGFGVSHPCLTFDRWQFIAVVDEAYNVIDAVRTFF